MCLQETHLKDHDNVAIRNYTAFHTFSANNESAAGGVSLSIIMLLIPLHTNLQAVAVSITLHRIIGGGRVVRWSWINFHVRGVLLVWIRVGQGPTALAVGAGGGCLDIFTLIYPFSFLSPSLWETTRYRLKYCLKGSLSPWGWSGGAKVLGKLPVPGRPTILITVGQGPTALAVGAGGGCLDIFTLIYPFSSLSPALWETARYRLKYCLKGPLNPKQPTNVKPKNNQPTKSSNNHTLSYKYISPSSRGGGRVVRWCWVNFQCRGVLQFCLQ